MDEQETEATIQKGVRQGCNLLPILFNVYIEQAIKEIKEKSEGGIVVQGEKIQTLRFVDDIIVLSESAEGLEKIMETKIMECGRKKSGNAANIKLENENLKEVDKFTYLGIKLI